MLRTIIGVLVSPVLGLISDYTARDPDMKTSVRNIRRLLGPYYLVTICFLVFGITIFFDNLVALWIAMIMLMLVSSWVYVYESLGLFLNL
jgi:hypothetical protein